MPTPADPLGGDLTPAEIAMYDQNAATLNTEINDLVQGYREIIAEHGPEKGLMVLMHRIAMTATVKRMGVVDLSRRIAMLVKRVAEHG